MKKFIEKYLGWLKDSNRPKHVKCGMLVYIVVLAICMTLSVALISATVIALVATAIVAMAVDYKDKAHGGKFDWLDVVATVLLPGVVTGVFIAIVSFL